MIESTAQQRAADRVGRRTQRHAQRATKRERNIDRTTVRRFREDHEYTGPRNTRNQHPNF